MTALNILMLYAMTANTSIQLIDLFLMSHSPGLFSGLTLLLGCGSDVALGDVLGVVGEHVDAHCGSDVIHLDVTGPADVDEQPAPGDQGDVL